MKKKMFKLCFNMQQHFSLVVNLNGYFDTPLLLNPRIFYHNFQTSNVSLRIFHEFLVTWSTTGIINRS